MKGITLQCRFLRFFLAVFIAVTVQQILIYTLLIVYPLFCFSQTGVELELVDSMPLLEWLANNYKSFGATLEIITDRSQEGSQYVRGFGGIGGTYLINL